jgi:dihydroxyacetone kinase-like protein
MDALVPAVQALRRSAEDGSNLGAAFERAAGAAEKGARSTEELEARFGRAKHAGARSVGHMDPGAASVSLLFKGLKQGVVRYAR